MNSMNKEFKRICPNCKGEVYHTSENNRNKSEKKNIICKNCDNELKRIKYKGENNPFYGKKHTDEVKEKLSLMNKGFSRESSSKFKVGHKSDHEKNFFIIWKNKYDEETYNKKVLEYKEKQRINSTGENNPMYGKPSPEGSGNGWSGWYKGWFFRSINELSYMINVIERFKLNWVTGESRKYMIPYVNWEGKERNYFPDFIINDKYIVECKPKRLWKTPNVKFKSEAAIKYCEKHNMIYKLVCCRKITTEQIIELYLNQQIKFMDKYEEKFKNKYLNN
jgi:hypothetical protein